MLAEIHLSATQALWPLLAAFAVIVGFVVWAYGRTTGSTAVRAVCTALKIIGIAALVLCLLDHVGPASRLSNHLKKSFSRQSRALVESFVKKLVGQAGRLAYAYAR